MSTPTPTPAESTPPDAPTSTPSPTSPLTQAMGRLNHLVPRLSQLSTSLSAGLILFLAAHPQATDSLGKGRGCAM